MVRSQSDVCSRGVNGGPQPWAWGGQDIHSVEDTAVGEAIQVRLLDGQLEAVVSAVHTDTSGISKVPVTEGKTGKGSGEHGKK